MRHLETSKLVDADRLNNSTYSAPGTFGLYMISLIAMESCGAATAPVTFTITVRVALETMEPDLSRPTIARLLLTLPSGIVMLQFVIVVHVGVPTLPLISMVRTSMGAVPEIVTRLETLEKLV